MIVIRQLPRQVVDSSRSEGGETQTKVPEERQSKALDVNVASFMLLKGQQRGNIEPNTEPLGRQEVWLPEPLDWRQGKRRGREASR